MKTLITVLFYCFISLAFAEDSELLPADLDIGEEINETCAGCHGEYAEGGKGGEYPRLAGLSAAYIQNQLLLFQNRSRPNIPMLEYLDKGQLPRQDMINIAGFLASIKLTTQLPALVEGVEFDAYERMMLTKKMLNIARFPGDIVAGKKIYNKECRNCHGNKAEGKENKGVPMLSGQYTKYLQRQVILFINKKRIHDVDAPDEELLADFSAEELNDIYAYLSILDDE